MTATQEAAHHVLGYYGMEGGIRAGGFTTSLIEAISRADMHNFALLKSVYPDLADAVYVYKNLEFGVAQLQEATKSAKELETESPLLPKNTSHSTEFVWLSEPFTSKTQRPEMPPTEENTNEEKEEEEAPALSSIYGNDLGSLFPDLKKVYSADINAVKATRADEK